MVTIQVLLDVSLCARHGSYMHCSGKDVKQACFVINTAIFPVTSSVLPTLFPSTPSLLVGGWMPATMLSSSYKNYYFISASQLECYGPFFLSHGHVIYKSSFLPSIPSFLFFYPSLPPSFLPAFQCWVKTQPRQPNSEIMLFIYLLLLALAHTKALIYTDMGSDPQAANL